MTDPTPTYPQQRVVILSVEYEETRQEWHVVVDEQLDGIPHEVRKLLVYPESVLAYRAAEYGIDPSDVDTLLDMVLCEGYVGQDWWRGQDNLFKAPTIADARARYLARIAEVKEQYGICESDDAPLQKWRERTVFDESDLAFKTMNTALLRHTEGVEVLPENVVRSFAYLRLALMPAGDRLPVQEVIESFAPKAGI